LLPRLCSRFWRPAGRSTRSDAFADIKAHNRTHTHAHANAHIHTHAHIHIHTHTHADTDTDTAACT
jgi:hypothetical protein